MTARKMTSFVMLFLTCAFLFGITAAPCFGLQQQPAIVGHWLGSLPLPNGSNLQFAFNISEAKDGLTASMDVPDQGVTNMRVDTITLTQRHLHLEILTIRGVFDGELDDSATIQGKWSQGGGTDISLELKRMANALQGPRRPQEPKRPFPYLEREVSIDNKEAGIRLSGTLTLPAAGGPFPAVFLISGSGPNDRDEFIWGHRVFLVLSDWLTRHGIAVLRADDRGTGKSTGDYSKAGLNEFASDALAAARFLKGQKEIDPKRIGLIGHSEGGIIAPLAATKSSDVSFLVLLAGAAEPLSRTVDFQYQVQFHSVGASDAAIAKYLRHQHRVYDILRQEENDAAAKQIAQSIDQLVKDLSSDEVKQLQFNENEERSGIPGTLAPEFRTLVNYDPVPTLQRVKCPVLALNGSKDIQVEPVKNLTLIKDALAKGGNPNGTVKCLEGLNHLFQTCAQQPDIHYEKIEETMAPLALQTISDWILAQATPGSSKNHGMK
jgi:uncharacterized protein